MLIDFSELEKFCTTTRQIKAITKLKKKFSISNATDKGILQDLMYSLFIHNQFQAISLIAPNLLTVKFEGNFNKWSGIENLLGILYVSKVLNSHQENTIFLILESIGNYPYKDKIAREINSTYLEEKLALCTVNSYINAIHESLDKKDARYEFQMRLGLIAAAAIVQIINKKMNIELDVKMDNIIQEQKKFLNEERLIKFT